MLVMISKRGYVTERFKLPCQNLGIDLKIDHVFEVLILREYRNRELLTEGWKLKERFRVAKMVGGLGRGPSLTNIFTMSTVSRIGYIDIFIYSYIHDVTNS